MTNPLGVVELKISTSSPTFTGSLASALTAASGVNPVRAGITYIKLWHNIKAMTPSFFKPTILITAISKVFD
jgi:hypothetical protein